MKHFSVLFGAALIGSGGFVFCEANAATYKWDVVAYSGQTTHGDTAGTYQSFGKVALSGNGQIAFSANISTQNEGEVAQALYRSSGGNNVQEILRNGDNVQSGLEIRNILENVAINDSGTVVLEGRVKDGNARDAVLVTNGSSSLVVAQEGNAAAGASGLTYKSFQDVDINNSGTVAFSSRLTDTSVSGGNLDSVYRSDTNGLSLVALEGQAFAPVPGATINGIGRNPLLDENGDIYFGADLVGEGINNQNDHLLAVDRSGVQEVLVRDGQTLSGDATSMNGIDTNNFNVSEDGALVFSSVESSLEQVHQIINGQSAQIAEEGDSIFGSGGYLGFPNGVNSGEFHNNAINDNGASLFVGSITHRVFGLTYQALLLENGGEIEPILATGDLLEFQPGDQRVITALHAYGGNESGDIAFNDSGDIALNLFFSDGSEAIVFGAMVGGNCGCGDDTPAPVPVPATVFFLGSGLFALGGLRRRLAS